MGALLERHGIGNGKYKVSGTYSENILELQQQAGRMIKTINLKQIDNSFNGISATKGELGNIYVSGSSNVGNLVKYNENDEQVFAVQLGSSNTIVSQIQFNKENEMLLCSTSNSGVYLLSKEGEIILNIPITGTALRVQLLEDRIFIATNQNNTSNIYLYNISGTLIKSFLVASPLQASFKNEHIYILSSGNNGCYKMDMNGVRLWQTTIQTSTNLSQPGFSITFEGENVYFSNQYSNTTSGSKPSYLLIVKDSDGSTISNLYRGDVNDTVSPNLTSFPANTRPQVQLPYGSSGNYYSNGVDYPIMVFLEGSFINVRSINQNGDIFSSFRIPSNTSITNSPYYKHAELDENRYLYLATTNRLDVYDVNSYYKIKR